MFNSKISLFILLLTLALGTLLFIAKPNLDTLNQELTHTELSTSQELSIITALPQKVHVDKAKAQLGKKLFNDPLLSANGSISCAFCHDLNNGGDDARKIAIGINGNLGTMNSPTVFNASYNFRQFWDGRAKDLKEQAFSPVQNPVEMGSQWPDVLNKLKRHEQYPKLFAKVYNDKNISVEQVTEAIAEFEKTLITPNSPFDKYLRGEAKALSDYELEGYQLFKDMGCINCHQGQNIGGNMYQKLGHFGNYFEGRTKLEASDYGLYNITKREEDKFKFKVPSLRNIAQTAPYFHDGQVATLEEAVELMAYYQLGRNITAKKRDKIVAFLKTLTGEYTALEE